MTTDSALQPFVTHIFTRLPCLIAAVVLLISEMIAMRKFVYVSVVGIVLFGGALIHVRDNEWPIGTGRHDLSPGYIAAQMVRDSTPPNSSLIVFGVDWNSEINYYAERKGLALPDWASLQKAGAILANPNAYMGGLEVGAVIDCRSVFQKYGPELDKLIDTFVEAWAQKSTLVSGPPNRVPVSPTSRQRDMQSPADAPGKPRSCIPRTGRGQGGPTTPVVLAAVAIPLIFKYADNSASMGGKFGWVPLMESGLLGIK